RLSVDELARRSDRAAERRRQRLVPEAHPEDAALPEETVNQVAENGHLVGPPGPWGEHEVARPDPLRRHRIDGIAPPHDDGRAESPEGLHEVPGEGVEAVDQENRRAHAVS